MFKLAHDLKAAEGRGEAWTLLLQEMIWWLSVLTLQQAAHTAFTLTHRVIKEEYHANITTFTF